MMYLIRYIFLVVLLCESVAVFSMKNETDTGAKDNPLEFDLSKQKKSGNNRTDQYLTDRYKRGIDPSNSKELNLDLKSLYLTDMRAQQKNNLKVRIKIDRENDLEYRKRWKKLLKKKVKEEQEAKERQEYLSFYKDYKDRSMFFNAVMNKLLECARTYAPEEADYSLLHQIIREDREVEWIKVFLKHNVNIINVRDAQGQTPLDVAIECGYRESDPLVKLLREKSAKTSEELCYGVK